MPRHNGPRHRGGRSDTFRFYATITVIFVSFVFLLAFLDGVINAR